jgi:solute carrier family 41
MLWHSELIDFVLKAQAIVVGLLASFAAILLSLVRDGQFSATHALILVSGSICTASMATLLLAAVMMCVILLSTKFRINPDNIATPLAASLGDLVTLLILAGIGTVLYNISNCRLFLSQ